MVLGGEAFGGMWLGHKGGALMKGIGALLMETPESFLTFSAMWGHSEKTPVYNPGSELSPDTQSAGALILDFPAFRTVRCVCCVTYPVCGILL